MAKLNRIEREEIKAFILAGIEEHPSDIAKATAQRFGVSRQTVNRYLRQLNQERKILAQGTTKARKYGLAVLDTVSVGLLINEHPDEDVVWRKHLLPRMENVSENVVDICQYGFTEMYNNAVSHSGSSNVQIEFTRRAESVELSVNDFGVGIWAKVQSDFDLYDPRHALLELSKGKLTSDEKHHSGQGIFFTSKMFDSFSIVSDSLVFLRTNKDSDDWLIEVKTEEKVSGTFVSMRIALSASRTVQDVFDNFSGQFNDYGFTKTHVPVQLALYEGEKLVSRSQAKRLLARFDKFREVLLDFRGVATIGQAFADEIFRVFSNQHPEIHITYVHTTAEIEQMITRATVKDVQPSLFEVATS